MPDKPNPRCLTVLARELISPHMLRITLGGSAMADFPPARESAYVKLRFAQPGSRRPLLRTYTIRAQRPEAIDIDFVRHGDGGPASRWAESVCIGQSVDVGGPGPVKRVDNRADWFLLVGDMTALPAIAANIEALPRTARGHAVIEVMDAADIQTLDAPPGLRLDWHVNPYPGQAPELLVNAVAALDWMAGRPSVWAACEFSAMQRLRRHFHDTRGLARETLYISSYWQYGADETRHKDIKRRDAMSAR